MKDNERDESFSDLEISVPKKQAPMKDIRKGPLMTGMGLVTFPVGESPTARQFIGRNAENSIEGWMTSKHPGVKHPSGDDLPYGCSE